MMRINNKKGVLVFPIIAFLIVGLVAVYLVVQIPLPAFTKIKAVINYFLILIFWVLIQIGLIAGYFYLGKLIMKGWRIYKSKLQATTLKFKTYLVGLRY